MATKRKKEKRKISTKLEAIIYHYVTQKGNPFSDIRRIRRRKGVSPGHEKWRITEWRWNPKSLSLEGWEPDSGRWQESSVSLDIWHSRPFYVPIFICVCVCAVLFFLSYVQYSAVWSARPGNTARVLLHGAPCWRPGILTYSATDLLWNKLTYLLSLAPIATPTHTYFGLSAPFHSSWLFLFGCFLGFVFAIEALIVLFRFIYLFYDVPHLIFCMLM